MCQNSKILDAWVQKKITEYYQKILPSIENILLAFGDMRLSYELYATFQASLSRSKYPLFPPLSDFKEQQTLWNKIALEMLEFKPVKHENNIIGGTISVPKVTSLIMDMIEQFSNAELPQCSCDIRKEDPTAQCNCGSQAICWKIAEDGRTVGGKKELIWAIAPLFALSLQSRYSNFVVAHANGAESQELSQSVYDANEKFFRNGLREFLEGKMEVMFKGQPMKAFVVWVADLLSTWTEAGLEYSSMDSKFCPICDAMKKERHNFSKWKKDKNLRKEAYDENCPFLPEHWVMDGLHARLRIQELLLRLLPEHESEETVENINECLDRLGIRNFSLSTTKSKTYSDDGGTISSNGSLSGPEVDVIIQHRRTLFQACGTDRIEGDETVWDLWEKVNIILKSTTPCTDIAYVESLQNDFGTNFLSTYQDKNVTP